MVNGGHFDCSNQILVVAVYTHWHVSVAFFNSVRAQSLFSCICAVASAISNAFFYGFKNEH